MKCPKCDSEQICNGRFPHLKMSYKHCYNCYSYFDTTLNFELIEIVKTKKEDNPITKQIKESVKEPKGDSQ